MKIALLQQNSTVGDFHGNATKIIEGYERACAQGADIAVGTELGLFGYPPRDLLEMPECLVTETAEFNRLCTHVGRVGLIVGVTTTNETGIGNPLFNSAAFIENGKCVSIAHKQLLPNYGVFDERRYFEPGQSGSTVLTVGQSKIGLLICEDIWNGQEPALAGRLYSDDPVARLEGAGLDALVVTNGSPYVWGKGRVRFNLVQKIAMRLGCNVIFVNQVGGNDDLVFDGRSFAIDCSGQCIGAACAFAEDLVIVDLDKPKPATYPYGDEIGDLYDALVMATRDYIGKVGCRNGVVIGLSGGIDSALTAAIAVDALGADKVLGVAMPSAISSEGSVVDAKDLARKLGIECVTVPIAGAVDSYGVTLEPVIGWYPTAPRPGDVTEENVQARIRGNILMAISNRWGRIVLTTGNKSEIAVGYCTLYGDMAGGFAVISDVPKTLVFKLAAYVNRAKERIPSSTITKPPSAELRPGQQDTDSLPPYDVLDPILEAYVEQQRSALDIVNFGFADEATVHRVIRMVNSNEFKRRQAAPGPKVTSVAFGTGRRMPIAARIIN